MGVASAISFNDWLLESMDPLVTVRIKGQYKPEGGLRMSQKPNITGTASAGSAEPDMQWVHGGSRIFRLTSRFRSKTFLDDIRKKGTDLELLRTRDPILGRAPRVSFSWADQEIVGFVTSLEVTILSLWPTGLPREIRFNMEITSAPDIAGEAGSGETQFIRFGSGETFETLGQRYLGSALLGELIRRQNPKVAGQPEQTGERVKVLEREHPAMRGIVEPQSPPFVGDWEVIVDKMAYELGDAKRGLPFDQLPEVKSGELVVP